MFKLTVTLSLADVCLSTVNEAFLIGSVKIPLPVGNVLLLVMLRVYPFLVALLDVPLGTT